MQTLLLFAHTFWKDSKVNKALLQSAESLPHLTIHNLSTTYQDGNINTQTEIALLQKADKIFFQFPLFWFSTPALMKEWQDRVLTGILYSDNPKLLQGKKFGIITTAYGEKSSYDGHHGYNIHTLLSPINHSFGYLGCDVQEAFCIFSANVNTLPTQEYLAKLKD
ncbi:NAD(P)H-dependent oxidoreductase [Helicobacter sp. MIT 14-3879]|uniref:NAD(P)H-dependent oxidoreductase n=1 Tax=Helicobacter sp. MIT 14-3879 TaxID=2040649 RepID=UPI000E1E64B7|nr:NAD(P)H-dependent oxidoreductase [Helicobacter sp. MIT 14-3879]RDU61342.1 flavodoxin family protein [Helicobacter sp. MIT 14-3879]